MKLSAFATNKKTAVEGVWVEAGGDLRLLIAKLGNPVHQKLAFRLMKPHMRKVSNGTIDPTTLNSLTAKIYAGSILLGWENLADDAGKVIEYSPEQAEKILTDYQDFTELVGDFAKDAEMFRPVGEEDAVGKSAKP